MIVKRLGGFVELIPSPAEKKREVVGDHVLDLLANLNARLARIEERLGAEAPEREDCATLPAGAPQASPPSEASPELIAGGTTSYASSWGERPNRRSALPKL